MHMILNRDRANVWTILSAALQGGDAHAGGGRAIKWLMDGSSARLKGKGESAVSEIILWSISIHTCARRSKRLSISNACTARCLVVQCNIGVEWAVV